MKIGSDWLHNTAVRPDPLQRPAGYRREGASSPVPPKFLVNADVDRPLIDIFHEATFSNPIGMQWIKDLYAFRTALRKAHCFTIDSETSAMLADFSFAIMDDLDSVRQMAIPPFPTTWFEIDNVARLKRCVELGAKLSTMASNNPCSKIGWLITSHGDEYIANYCAVIGQGPVVSPLAYRWRVGAPSPCLQPSDTITNSDLIVFNVQHSMVAPEDASLCKAWPMAMGHSMVTTQEVDLMVEIAGELRFIFGLLLSLGAAHAGAETSFAAQPPAAIAPFQAKGKMLFPIEHKILTIKLARKSSPAKVAARLISGHKKRWHEVRLHWRRIKTPDGGTRLVKVSQHSRGDERLGKITKTYRVEK